MRVLGVDFGGKRIGIAVGETEHQVATPRAQLEATGTLKLDAENIVRLCKTEECASVVIGIPLVDGEETKMSRICRMLGDQIETLGMTVAFIDESLSSSEGAERLQEHQWTAATRRRHLDSEAACIILERYFGQA